jgi:hypothetical protein
MTFDYLRCQLHRLRTDLDSRAESSGRMRGDLGAMTTETVIIIAGLAALALAVVAIIVAKVTDKANSIPTT